jgi:membrane peptidoglycan carboxypeptidase
MDSDLDQPRRNGARSRGDSATSHHCHLRHREWWQFNDATAHQRHPANDVTEALIRVTGKKGTAYRAHIPGFRIAGKTGTAQKIEDGHYSKQHHITSFVGYVPAQKPAFCMLVLFDQTRLSEHEDVGGITAAPVFKTMGYEPDPAIILQDKEDAKNLARNER